MTLAFPKPVRVAKVRRPLVRKHWMRKKAPKRLKREGSDRAYLAWLHTLPCCYAPWCKDGPIEAAHHRDMTGLGRKEDDSKAIPLCRSHHRQFDGHYGAFLLAEKEQRKLWFLAKIAQTQAAYPGSRPPRDTTKGAPR